MDYKKLSDAIRLCGSTPKINECKEKCPYYAGGDMMKCIPVMTKDAADAIEKLSGLLRYEYKGYYTSPHWNDYDGVFYGKIELIDDVVAFHGETYEEFENSFRIAVDDYINLKQEIEKDTIDLRLLYEKSN